MPKIKGVISPCNNIKGAIGFKSNVKGAVKISSVVGNNHSSLNNRDAANQHPISAITGLQAALDGLGELSNLNTEDKSSIVAAINELAASGGGGGGGGTSYIVTLTNTLTSRNITVATGSTVVLAFNYSSVDSDSMDDGPGIGTLTINGLKVATFNMQQGANILDISSYLSAGTNNIRVKVENSEGSVKTLAYTATVVSLNMSTTFDELATYAGTVLFSYTLNGSGTKTVHFLMDGEEIDTATVTTSGRSNSYTIAAQSAGAHIFSAYAEVSVDGVTVQSNTIRLGMLWIDESSTDPVLASTFAKESATQGETLEIPYMVYDPSGESASITLVVLNPDGTTYSSNSITIDRTRHTWNVSDYPSGNVKFRINCGGVNLDLPVTVSAYTLPVSPVSDGLLLEFSADGRSNAEENPNQWKYGDIAATFNGFGWSKADGWISDADGAPVLRFLPGDTMTIPLQPFASDARDTGYTIEVELATRNVRDYDSIAFSCLSGGRGVKIASQEATLKSEQSTVSMLFKEDSRVRVTFVIEQRNLNRLIYIYINGILCGVSQYPTNDNFAQASPVGLSIGSNTCGIDLYKIRCYSKGLTRGEQLDNFICDRSTLAERQSAYARNNILDESDEVVISKLPTNLPYLVIACPELPQYKGDKKTGVELSFVDPSNTARSFNAVGVEMDVQGTSSAGYPVKNEKLKLKSGIQYTASGNVDSGFPISPGALPTVTICLKVDFASSENANNVMLADYYNSLCPYQTPAQEADPRVRQGIEGFACAIFWQNTATSEVTFIGKGNMNVDKGNPNIFGFTDDFPDAESWEFLNNTSNRTLFKTSDFNSGWTDDFEARFPEDNTNIANFKRLTDWLVSTNRDVAGLSTAQKAARLEKFRTEAEDYLVLDACLFYYLFTETFLMVDSRAKNMFMTTFDGLHWFSLPYDFDTAIGINNEGALVFEYDLEDTDRVNNANVFNGQTSTLWNNIRDAFGDELKSMYSSLRSGGNFSYQTIKTKMENHQSVWPEAMWNEDAFIKYLQPYLLNGENYLSMLQGSKSSQRDWWLFNAFRYRDSKYQCGDASANFITLRCYAVGNITVTPYSHIWPRVKYGSNTAFCRGKRNTAYEMVCTLDNMDDTEVYIYSADRIASIGSLSHLQVGYANFSMATKLQSIILGSDAEGYTNPKLEELYVGNNELLTEVNIENCVNLTMPIDLSGCASIATVKATGSAITGVNLPNGGHLTTLELPDTVTNFTIQNQHDLETLTFAGYDELTTLRVENTPNVPLEEIINGADNLNRVRLIGVEWDAEDETSLQAIIDKLKTCIGMDANGNNTVAAVVNGRVNVSSISSALLTEINETFPDLVVVVNSVPQYLIRFLNYDNSVVYRMVVAEGEDATDPVAGGLSNAPTKPGTDEVHYVFSAWSSIPTNVQGNQSVVAQYVTSYRVQYKNWDGTVLQTKYVVSGGTASYTGSTPSRASTAQYTYTFTGWSGTQTNITSARDITAQYSSTVRKYTVYFYNGSTLLQTVQNVSYGGSATYTGSTPVDPDGNDFEGWSPSPTNITGNTSCYAQFATDAPTATSAAGAYGVQWDYSQSSPALTRVGLAASFAAPAPATSLAGSGSSPFDNIAPWKDMKRYNVINGAISYSDSDAGFSATDYDTVVYIPEFYYTAYKDTTNSKWLWAISPTPLSGFVKHPGSGRYVGRYHTSGSSSGVFSKSGALPLVNTSQTNFRTYSKNKGAGWYMNDIATWSALQLLYLVEYANFDSQTTLGTGYAGVTSAVAEVGATDNAAYHTLKISGGHNQYRWIEDPFSNCGDWIDGFLGGKSAVYAGTKNASFNGNSSNLTSLGFALPSSGDIQGFGYSAKAPWAFIPDTASGTDDTKYVCDRVISPSGSHPIHVGGAYGTYADYGFFYFDAYNIASDTYASLGSRLLFIP